MNKNTWVLIDDARLEALSFAEEFTRSGEGLAVDVMTPKQARELLLTGKLTPAGVLVDVDLSSIQGETGTGPGIAQDLRVKQRARAISEYPVVRFAALAPVSRNVRGDPSSDDLFDIKIQKEDVARGVGVIIQQLTGLQEIYERLGAVEATEEFFLDLMGCAPSVFEDWGHSGFQDRLLSTLAAVHVAAGVLMRSFLLPPGLLIDEDLLAVRLGIDAVRSGDAWSEVKSKLTFQYQGVGHAHFPRWWARGLEAWWFDNVDASSSLVALAADKRVAALKAKYGLDALVTLEMPMGSPGSAPWQFCTLCLEKDPPLKFPVDAMEAVRVTRQSDFPVWVDPSYASLKYALQERDDLRLSRADKLRLKKKYNA